MDARRALATLALVAAGCASGATSPVASVMETDHVVAPSLTAPVDVVRDEYGVPHIYGATFDDVVFAEGYVQAADRWVPMDLVRHNADGTVARLVGNAVPSVLDTDIAMRTHHFRATAQAQLDKMKASSDPDDARAVKLLESFAAGVNAYVADLQAGKYSIPPQLVFLYDPKSAEPWTPTDTLMVLQFQTFFFGYDGDSDIFLTQLEQQAARVFDQSMDPALAARKGLGADLHIFAPLDPTHVLDGWTGMNGDTTHASLAPTSSDDGNLLALLAGARDTAARTGVGAKHMASNNWAIGPSLSASGHVLVANDTHVPLFNPPIWWLAHVHAGGALPVDAMGVSFPGIPAIVLGMTEHIAWAATTNQLDITDVYQETIVACDGTNMPCVAFQGRKVPLAPRVEKFDVGQYGKVSRTVEVTLYDVPHHGPILPRVKMGAVEPLGQTELSVRWTGYEPGDLGRVIVKLAGLATAADFFAALDADNKSAAFNWVAGDDQGHFGWTEVVRMPRRAAGFAPWKVLPGDGTAEWGADLDPKYIPHAYDPAKGFVATANNDPIGVTDQDDPFFGQPMVDGAPLYIGYDFDAGARAGRVTKRILAGGGGGKKLSIDDMSSIQADAVYELGQLLAPTLADAAKSASEEVAAPGTHPDVKDAVAGASGAAKALLPTVQSSIAAWSFDTPAADPADSPTANQVADSQATVIFESWMRHFLHDTLDDETAKLGLGIDSVSAMKLVVRACTHPELLKSGLSPAGDPIVFDDLATPSVVETRRAIAVRALFEALDQMIARLGGDATKWRWGQLHTLTLDFLAPMDALKIPLKTDKSYPNGFPRHGAYGTPDIGGYSMDLDDYSNPNSDGPGIRFVCELTPTGPRARNVLPGGETFDPASPHYRDQLELWRKNQAFDLAFTDADVLASANRELAKNGIGRTRFDVK